MLVAAVRQAVAAVGLGGGAMVPVAMAMQMATSSHRDSHMYGRFHNVWEQILQSARSNPEKLHDIVDTLSRHCISQQAAPPLDSFNELLRICDAHGDISSVSKLCQMACAVSMHLDEVTYERLVNAYHYFPKPFPEHTRMAQDSHSTISNGLMGPHTSNRSTVADNHSNSGSSTGSGSSSSFQGPLAGSNAVNAAGASNAEGLPSTAPVADTGARCSVEPAAAQPIGSSRSSSNSSSDRSPSYGRYGTGGHGGRMRD